MRVPLLRRLLNSRPPLPPFRRTYSAATPPQPTPDSPDQQPQPQSQPQPQPQPQLQPQPQPQQPQQPQPQPPPLTYPAAPSPHHTTLPTFLAHAARTNLDPSSTVYVGTHFEYTALHALARYGLALRRVGGVSDGGIDLLGTWTLPLPDTTNNFEMRVLAQCKAVQRAGPHLVRELEGAFAAAPAGWRGRSGVMGLLVGRKAATKGMREAVGRSRWPMGFVACSPEGRVEQFLWNRRAEEEGLEGVGVGMRYGGGGGERELVLTWRGRNLPFVEGGGG